MERVSDCKHYNLLIKYAASALKSEVKFIFNVVYDWSVAQELFL